MGRCRTISQFLPLYGRIGMHTRKHGLIRVAGVLSFGFLITLSYLFVNPTTINSGLATLVYAEGNDTPATSGTPLPSLVTLNIDLTHPNASVELTPHDSTGTFSSSSEDNSVAFNVSTNNYTGYTLYISSSSNDGYLFPTGITTPTTENSLSSIDEITTESDFSNPSSTTLNNKWGYKPSKYNSETNTSFIPAPSITNPTTGSAILDTTATYNTTTSGDPITSETNTEDINANAYTIGLGARVDSTIPTGSYEATFVLQVVGNPVPVTITYTDTSGDTSVTSTLPSIYHGELSDTEAPISTTIPTRTGYTFKSWCLGEVTAGTSSNNYVDTCTGTTYNPSTEQNTQYIGVDLTHSNTMTLVAMWERNKYLQTIQTRTQNADGTWSNNGSYTDYASCTEEVYYGMIHSCNFAVDTTIYNVTNVASYTVTSANTIQRDINRNTRTVTLTKGTGISAVSVTGTGVKTGSGTASATIYYGGAITITATMTSGYDWVNWTGSATYTNISQSISNVTSNLSFTANGKVSCANISVSGTMQAFNPASNVCNGTSGTLKDSRDNKSYTVAKINDQWWMTKNLDLAGGTTLTSSTSNVSSNYTLPASNAVGFYDDNTAYVYNSGSTTCGNKQPCYSYYSWRAATAGAGTTSITSGNVSQDICPKGWRLPTKAEYITLISSYSTGEALTAAPFYGVYAGESYRGSFNQGGTVGHYWFSTANSSDTAQYWYFSSSSVNKGSTFKRSGFPVRCVK